MTSRDILREQFVGIIENQLNEDLEPYTIDFYHQILKEGMNEERAKELIAFYLEMFVKGDVLGKGEEYDSKKWKEFLDGLEPIYHIPGEYTFDYSDERRNLRNIQRRYGQLKNDTGPLEDELFELEAHLLVLHELYGITAYEAKKIIHIVINRIFDYESQDTSDYSDYAHEDILSLADGLEKMCNPYVNEQLYKYLSQYIDLEDENQFDKLFKNIFLCLSRVLVSIDKFEKELGKDGYFHFISQFIDLDACIESGPAFFFNEHTLNK